MITKKVDSERPKSGLVNRMVALTKQRGAVAPGTDNGDVDCNLSTCTSNTSRYSPIQIIGKGAFGKVVLVLDNSMGEHQALKVLSKSHLEATYQMENFQREMRLMRSLNNAFITKICNSFDTEKNYYMALEFCQGGELSYHMGPEKNFSVAKTRFYCSEIAMALGYLHQQHICFRDLKPENVLLDNEGHIKISDFGLAAENISSWMSGCKTTCGTPHYMAPEVFLTDDYGLGCDWWSLGIIAYQMVLGMRPFRGKTIDLLFQNVIAKPLVMIKSWPDSFKLFIRTILSKRPDQRLGNLTELEPAAEVLSHPFFTQPLEGDETPFLVDAVRKMEITPPIRPRSVYRPEEESGFPAPMHIIEGDIEVTGRSLGSLISSDCPSASGVVDVNRRTVGGNSSVLSEADLNIDARKLGGMDVHDFGSLGDLMGGLAGGLGGSNGPSRFFTVQTKPSAVVPNGEGAISDNTAVDGCNSAISVAPVLVDHGLGSGVESGVVSIGGGGGGAGRGGDRGSEGTEVVHGKGVEGQARGWKKFVGGLGGKAGGGKDRGGGIRLFRGSGGRKVVPMGGGEAN